jgi:hypothetical protein
MDNGKEKRTKVVCGVKNCVYHFGEHGCKASPIVVGPTFASSGADTVCATFKPKSQ